MALVAYGCSDSSDIEDEEEHQNNKPTDVKKISNLPESDTTNTASNCGVVELSLFKTLPKPTQNKVAVEEDDEFLHKKETLQKAKTKIIIPSLSEFKDLDDGPATIKKYNLNEKKSGLLSILPEPKFSGNSTKKVSKPLIPNSIQRKIINIAPNPPPKESTVENPFKVKSHLKKPFPCNEYSDSDDDNQQETSYAGDDFFSIHTQAETTIEENGTQKITEDQNTWPVGAVSEMVQEGNVTDNLCQEHIEMSEAKDQNHTASAKEPNPSDDLQLDDEAIRQLCGSKKRHKKEDIKFITVDQQQVLSDSREWLVKGLMDDTSKRVSSSKRKGNEPTSQQKRKHQITYLAHQAKANEAELQNQWANNRMSKRQTQSKYGF